ncbi:MAG: efflux RND transporter periplasmic adaptor subunit [Ignavibacteriaceae bacterium]
MANGKKKSRKKLFIFGGIGLLIIILIVIAFVGGSKEEIIAVQTEKVQKRNITQIVTATGNINPEYNVVITPEVTGEIIALPVKEGDYVKKGDLLIKIKGDQYIAQKERLEANVLSAKANLQQRQAEFDRVSLEYQRVKELHSKGLSSDAELEASKSSFLTAKALVEAAEASVLQSEASLKEVKEQIYKTTIYAPMEGTITKLNVELGERVFGAGFSMGTDIMTISDLESMEAVVQVDENDVILVSIGDTANITVDAFKDKIFHGVVTEIGNSAQTRGLGTQDQVVNFDVKIKLLELDDKLRPGMSCNADIETETKLDVISVPLQSVTARSNSELKLNNERNEADSLSDSSVNNPPANNSRIIELVFVVENGKAKAVPVKTGISDDNFIEIISGLEEGQEVVTGSYRAISRELKDGSTVRVENGKSTFAETEE